MNLRIHKKQQKAREMAKSVHFPSKTNPNTDEHHYESPLWWEGAFSVVEDCAEDLGSADIGVEYLKTRLSQLEVERPGELIVHMMACQAIVPSNVEGFVKIKPSRERPALDEVSKDMFESFWATYPRKEGKLRCMRVWERFSAAERSYAVEGAKRFGLTWSGRPENEIYRFCTLPCTWLMEKRFLDLRTEKKIEEPQIKAGQEWIRKEEGK